MNWSDVGEAVAGMAPAIGTALLGPAGTAVGSLVASAFGTESNPDKVAAAIKADPEAAVKLRRIERKHETEITRLVLESKTAQMAEINKTMRAELVAENWFKSGWRPAIGWVVALSVGGILGSLAYALFKNPAAAPEIVGQATTVLVTVLGLLGYNVRQRSRDKEVLAGLRPSGLVEAIAERVRGAK